MPDEIRMRLGAAPEKQSDTTHEQATGAPEDDLDLHEIHKYFLEHIDGIVIDSPFMRSYVARLREMEAEIYRDELAKARADPSAN